MDTATIGLLGGMITVMMTIVLTVMIYLDRARGADMAAGFAAIGRRFDRSEERVDRRFDRVDKKFDRVDERFDRVDKKFDRVDERFDEFTGVVVDLAREVGEVKGRLAVSAPVEAFTRVE